MVAKEAEDQRRKEPAESSHGSDQARHGRRRRRKVLRHELEDGAAADAEQGRAAERADGERHHRVPHHEERERDQCGEHAREHARSSEVIREDPAERPQQRGHHHEPRGPQSRIGQRERELVAQERGQVHREGDETAEGQEVERREHPRDPLGGENRQCGPEGRGPRGARGVAGGRGKDRCPGQAEDGDAIEDRVAPEGRRCDGPEKDGRRVADIAQPVNAQGGSLRAGREPARAEADADGERRACESEQEGRGEQTRVGVRGWNQRCRDGHPDEQQRKHDPPAEPIRQQSGRKPRDRAQQNRDGDEQRRGLAAEVILGSECRSERADKSPRREGQGEREGGQREVAPGTGLGGRHEALTNGASLAGAAKGGLVDHGRAARAERARAGEIVLRERHPVVRLEPRRGHFAHELRLGEEALWLP